MARKSGFGNMSVEIGKFINKKQVNKLTSSEQVRAGSLAQVTINNFK
jgi:hypothetical protein